MHKTRSVILLIILLQSMSIQVVPTLGVEAEPEGTLVGGKIRSNTVWTKENSPYILKDNIRIPRSVKLSIEEGVVVDFHIWSMTIEGSLRVRGTPEERILFNISDTTLSGYNKARIYFTDESIPWMEGDIDSCLLEYVDIFCANYTVEFGIIRGSTLKLDHVSIFGSRYHINDYYAVNTDGIITNCLFDNVLRPVCMEDGVIQNNKFLNIKKGPAIKIVNGTARDNFIDNAQIGINVKNAFLYNNTILNTNMRGIMVINNEIPYEEYKLRPRIIENVIRACKQDAIFISGEIRPLIRRNIIMDNLNGIYFDEDAFRNGTIPRIEYNVFYNNDNNIYVEKEDPRIMINLNNNWWATNDTKIIEEKIYHEHDDSHLNFITYEPFLTTLPSNLPELKYEYEVSVNPVEIELKDKITISGNVNPPLEKFEIYLTCTGPDQDSFYESLTTDADGSFSYKFTPESVGVWKATLIPAENQLFVDSDPRNIEFEVTKRSSRIDDCTVSPEVLLKDDNVTITGVLKPRLPNEFIQVRFTNPNGVTYNDQIKTDSEGRFKHVLIGKVPGNYSVDFSWHGTAEVEEASKTVVFNVHEPGWLKIVIKDKLGSPVQDASIKSIFQPSGQGSLASKTDSNGTVVFSEILYGDYDFIVEKENFESSTISSLVAEGETFELEVNIETSGSTASAASQTDRGQSTTGEAPLLYGLIPSILTFVILIILYMVLHRGNSR
jgi:hypothetical protein